MIPKTALIAIVALLFNSAGLLLCQWECATAETSRHAASACHKSQDDAPAFQTAEGHDCVATSTAPVTTSAKSVERASHRAVVTSLWFSVAAIVMATPH